MDKDKLIGELEAILFIYGEPVKMKKLAEITGTETKDIEAALGELQTKMKEGSRGIDLMILEDKATLVTKAELNETVKKVVKEELDSELTPASLETLAIIAYLAQVSRAEIDYIRGVNSSFILRNLMIRGLVQKEIAKDKAGNNLYTTTFDFLKHIGLNSLDALPEFERFRSLIRDFSRPEERQDNKPEGAETQVQTN